MGDKEKVIRIINEGTIEPNSSFTLHINYNESLTLKELSELLEFINKNSFKICGKVNLTVWLKS